MERKGERQGETTVKREKEGNKEELRKRARER